MKVYNEIELLKRLLEEKDTLTGYIHYKSVSLKKDGVLVLLQFKVGLDMKDTFLKIQNKPIPFVVFSKAEIIKQIIEEIEFDKEEEQG